MEDTPPKEEVDINNIHKLVVDTVLAAEALQAEDMALVVVTVEVEVCV